MSAGGARSPARRLAGLTVAAVVLAGGTAPAQSRAEEHAGTAADGLLLVGPRQQPVTAGASGVWQARPGAVTPSEATGRRGGYWLAGGASIADGTVRARFAVQRRLDATLLMRAGLDAAGRLRGVGVRVRGRWARVVWVRDDALVASPLGSMLPQRAGRRGVEITMSVLGTALVADIRDADSGEHLAVVSSNEAGLSDGAVALFIEPSSSRRPSPLERLSVRRACQAPPERAMPACTGVASAAAVDACAAPGEPAIVALVPALEAEAARLHALELERLGDGRVAMRTDAAGLERLFCDRRSFAVETDLPWKYLDLEHLRRRALGEAGGALLGSGYSSPAMVEATLAAWQRRYPDRARVEELGRSVQGRPIHALAIGAGSSGPQSGGRPALLLTGAVHGDELLATEIVLDAARGLLERGDEPRVRRWLEEAVIWCVPMVNPDGVQAFLDTSVRAGRKNGRDTDGDGERGLNDGVDLNRNFPFRWQGQGQGVRVSDEPLARHYRGPSPASEPETRALMALAERERFVAAISYHLGTIAVLAPYTVEGVRSPEPNEAWLVAEEMTAGLPPHPEGRRFAVARNLYPVLGTDQDWLRHAHGTVALIVEAGGWPPPLDAPRRAAALGAVRPTWQLLLDRFLDGPALSGRVRDASGAPVSAAVEIVELPTFEGERWTSNARDGGFHRYLPTPGRYHLRVSAPGYAPLERELRIGRERVSIELQLRSPATAPP